MGCPGCFETGRGLRIEFEDAIKKAKEHARKTGTSVAIYSEAGEYKFINAVDAIIGSYPIVKMVSYHSAITTE